jgi:hypothetical protein
MADARTSAIPFVNSDESDWTLLFAQWEILPHDRQIGHCTRALGSIATPNPNPIRAHSEL